MAKTTRNFLLGALAGGIAGSVTALLLAPKSGRELRKDIVVSAQQVTESTTRIAKQVGSGATEFAGKAKDTASNVFESVRSWRSSHSDDELDDISADAGNLIEAEATENVEVDADKSTLQTIS